MDTKAARAELTSLGTDLEMRFDNRDIKLALDTKISKSEFAHAISKKPDLEEVRAYLEPMVTLQELQTELRKVFQRVDSLDSEFELKLESTATTADIQNILARMPDRDQVDDIEDTLRQVVTKEALATALQRKMDRNDVDSVLGRKADAAELHAIVAAVESKADQSWVEQIISKLDDKVDRSEITLKILPELNNKLDRQEIDALSDLT